MRQKYAEPGSVHRTRGGYTLTTGFVCKIEIRDYNVKNVIAICGDNWARKSKAELLGHRIRIILGCRRDSSVGSKCPWLVTPDKVLNPGSIKWIRLRKDDSTGNGCRGQTCQSRTENVSAI